MRGLKVYGEGGKPTLTPPPPWASIHKSDLHSFLSKHVTVSMTG